MIDYAKDEEKTEQEFYVEGINCNPETARDQFVSVKQGYGKEDGIQAYHGYLSFKEQDISPELAQKIGMEFANEVWGKRYQIVVTTHLNTKHLHCHFVINSVSFVDGKRLWGEEKAWFKFRLVADRICEKYGLYYNPKPNRSKQSSYYYKKEKAGMPTRYTMQTVVQEINVDYDGRLQEIKNSVSYDKLEMSGSRAVWKDVLAVYSVKVNTDPDNAQEVATMNDEKKQLLKDIFWEMNEISSRTETKLHTEITETDDGHGNIVQTETTVTETFLYITVSHKTVDEMAAQYGFNEEQKEYLAELLQEENNSLWSAVLYGIGYSDDQIVTVALSQVGNVGGEPYWSWYGFNSRVEWCACFVSWCANECGYIDAGIIPKYAGCVNGVQWFKARGQWIDGSLEPVAGMIIFFDWDNKGSSGPQDGLSDHTGIVEKVENGIVYTVEGNSGDSCRINQYAVGHYEILGYGAPQY